MCSYSNILVAKCPVLLKSNSAAELLDDWLCLLLGISRSLLICRNHGETNSDRDYEENNYPETIQPPKNTSYKRDDSKSPNTDENYILAFQFSYLPLVVPDLLLLIMTGDV